ncbi:MAG: type II toxin-antitoxin system Phd/YefM family antitoxin [Xanthomonadaceae bacterium]|nr:type II toxin-antitoxin system Phd/YefM family antitoxin [Xanthomonadaceae bacterium]
MSQSSLKLDAIDKLPRKAASDVKKLGWRGVMQVVDRAGKVVVTNHKRPEAVILSIEEYDAIRQALSHAAARQEPVLEILRRRFDERLAALQEPDAGERLHNLLRQPARLDGQARAGEGF